MTGGRFGALPSCILEGLCVREGGVVGTLFVLEANDSEQDAVCRSELGQVFRAGGPHHAPVQTGSQSPRSALLSVWAAYATRAQTSIRVLLVRSTAVPLVHCSALELTQEVAPPAARATGSDCLCQIRLSLSKSASNRRVFGQKRRKNLY